MMFAETQQQHWADLFTPANQSVTHSRLTFFCCGAARRIPCATHQGRTHVRSNQLKGWRSHTGTARTASRLVFGCRLPAGDGCHGGPIRAARGGCSGLVSSSTTTIAQYSKACCLSGTARAWALSPHIDGRTQDGPVCMCSRTVDCV